MKATGICLILFLFNAHVFAQVADTAAIKRQLAAIYDRDQMTRKSSDSAAFRQMIDSTNLVQVESLIAKYGWMGKSFIGDMGNYTIWLVIQHADLAKQEKYLPMLQESVNHNESRAVDLAYLEDRVLMRRGEKQIYGTQITLNKTGGQEIWPIKDEVNVNLRRATIGLEPMEDYAKNFGIDYHLPVKQDPAKINETEAK